MRKTLLTAVLLLTAIALQAKDIKTVVLTTTPVMHCENCETKIKGNLRFEKGVKSIETNIEAQTVTVQYDADKTTEETITEAFTKFGYTAKKVDTTDACKENNPCCETKKACCSETTGSCAEEK